MSTEDIVGEPDVLPQPIVDWQPTHTAEHQRPAMADSSRALSLGAAGALAFGALALGALAIGALAVGHLAIGRLAVGRTRLRRVEIDELVVGRLSVLKRG